MVLPVGFLNLQGNKTVTAPGLYKKGVAVHMISQPYVGFYAGIKMT